jgi:hypothetical protein
VDCELLGFFNQSYDFSRKSINYLFYNKESRIFFSAKDYTNMSYYNCCGIRPKHSNISKRVGEGVFTICVVLDQSTVIFQEKKILPVCPMVQLLSRFFVGNQKLKQVVK